MNYEYSYLIAALISLFVWIFLFFWRRNLRKEMLVMSLLIGFLGLFLGLIYTLDWWHPLTITKTIIGFEDFIFGFSLGGTSAVIYEAVFKKRIKIRKIRRKEEIRQNYNFLFLFTSSLILFLFFFYTLRLNSFYSSIIGLLIPILFTLVKNPIASYGASDEIN
ncbi:MAG: hypothetical protein AABW75_03390 [Nanoarchaeota archaeon]